MKKSFENPKGEKVKNLAVIPEENDLYELQVRAIDDRTEQIICDKIARWYGGLKMSKDGVNSVSGLTYSKLQKGVRSMSSLLIDEDNAFTPEEWEEAEKALFS